MRQLIAALAVGLVFASAPAAQAQEPEIKTSNWNAWVDRMPPGPATFYLTGIVELPHGGFDVSLEPANPQGFNPAILMMTLTVTERPGMHTQAVEAKSVRYEISPYPGGLYREVTILYNGEMVGRVGAIGSTY